MQKPLSLYAHNGPDTDIALLKLEAAKPGDVVSEETEFGLRDIDRPSGRVVGLEVWDASTRLPLDTIDAVHLAPALRLNVQKILSCDRRMLDAATALGFELSHPGLSR